MVASAFRPAASYLLAGEPSLPDGVDWVLVEDSDVGPMWTHPDDIVVGHNLRETGTWDPGEGRFLRSVLRPGMNIIDIGANIGYFTLLMARAVSTQGRVLAVEAEPINFQILRTNIGLSQMENVEVLPVAAHRCPGLTSVARDLHNHGGSIAFNWAAPWHGTPTQAVRLDDVLNPNCEIHFIKIDIEGMDHAAVQGLERTIRHWEPMLLVELNPEKTEMFGDSPHDVLRLYRELGLSIRLLGADAVRLHRDAGMAVDSLLLDELYVTPELEAELIERTRHIHYVNLLLAHGSA